MEKENRLNSECKAVKSKKQFEILPSLPTYGPMYIPVSETGKPFYSEGFPVRFYRRDGTEWVANFEPGWTDLKQVIQLDNTDLLLVIACGTCYLMDPDDTKPVAVFGVGYSHILQANASRYVLHDETHLTVIAADGTHWRTERISWDGLADVRIEKNVVSGLAFSPTSTSDEWVAFSYDLDTGSLVGGGFR